MLFEYGDDIDSGNGGDILNLCVSWGILEVGDKFRRVDEDPRTAPTNDC